MTNSIAVDNRAGLATAAFDALTPEIEQHTTMERALAWFFQHEPPLKPEDLIAQDEFSFDLLVPYKDGLFLSYDTS